MSASETKKEVKKLKVPKEFFYGTGKRKNAIAKVWLFTGKGDVSMNNKELSDASPQEGLVELILQPLNLLNLNGKYDVRIQTTGGGYKGQAEAAQLGIARALVEMNETFKKALKDEGLLTRDSRVKERKKYGRKKARKGFQYRKR